MFSDSFPQVCKVKMISCCIENCCLWHMTLIIIRNCSFKLLTCIYPLRWLLFVPHPDPLYQIPLLLRISTAVAPRCTSLLLHSRAPCWVRVLCKLQLNPQFFLISSPDLFSFPHPLSSFARQHTLKLVPGQESTS